MSTLSNEFVTLRAKPEGAELCSIQTSDGTEHLWQADPSVWSRHAPILFPIVGKLKNNQYAHNGKMYELPQHGFARDMTFALLEQTEDTLVYQLLPTNETNTVYPFDFELRVLYRLNGNSITVEYEVRNHGQDTMPFSIGAHPGFNLPSKLDECFLTLEKETLKHLAKETPHSNFVGQASLYSESLCPAHAPEYGKRVLQESRLNSLQAHLLSDDGLLSSETVSLTNQSDCIPITQTLFDRDALILLDVDFEKLTIASQKSDTRIALEFSGFPQLGIWAKPGAPYICIEPWFGYADPQEPYGDISNKPGIQILPAGETFRCTQRITIESFVS